MKFSEIREPIKMAFKEITFNGKNIKVKQYLPVTEKSQLIMDIFSVSPVEKGNVNYMMLSVGYDIYMIKHYTDIEYEEETLSDIYDYIHSSGLFNEIFNKIPVSEKSIVETWIQKEVDNALEYQRGARGIMEAIVADYDLTKFKAEDIADELRQTEGLTLIKDIVDKLG